MSTTPYTGGFIDPSRPNPMGSNDARIIIYGYIPSQVLSLLAIALFAAFFFVHTYQVVHYRFWSFIPVTAACLMEIVGYLNRYLSYHKDPYNKIYFIIAYFFIVVAPVLISASIYVCLTKLIRWASKHDLSGRHQDAILKPKALLWFFVSADVITTLIQVTGAGLIGSKTSKQESPKSANDILLAGLAIQTFCFTVFLVLFTRFIFKSVSYGPYLQRQRAFVIALAASSVLVLLRTIFRLVETAQGVFGFLSSHEAFFGTLEFAPIILAVGILAVWHPARWLREESKAQQ